MARLSRFTHVDNGGKNTQVFVDRNFRGLESKGRRQ